MLSHSNSLSMSLTHILLLINLTTATLFLPSLQPISGFTDACTEAYSAGISSCPDATSFTDPSSTASQGSSICSTACFVAIKQSVANIQIACQRQTAYGSTVIGHAFVGDLAKFLCSGQLQINGDSTASNAANTATTTTSTNIVSTATSSTLVTRTSNSVTSSSPASTITSSTESSSSSSGSTTVSRSSTNSGSSSSSGVSSSITSSTSSKVTASSSSSHSSSKTSSSSTVTTTKAPSSTQDSTPFDQTAGASLSGLPLASSIWLTLSILFLTIFGSL